MLLFNANVVATGAYLTGHPSGLYVCGRYGLLRTPLRLKLMVNSDKSVYARPLLTCTYTGASSRTWAQHRISQVYLINIVLGLSSACPTDVRDGLQKQHPINIPNLLPSSAIMSWRIQTRYYVRLLISISAMVQKSHSAWEQLLTIAGVIQSLCAVMQRSRRILSRYA